MLGGNFPPPQAPTSAAMLGANSPPSKLLIHHPPNERSNVGCQSSSAPSPSGAAMLGENVLPVTFLH